MVQSAGNCRIVPGDAGGGIGETRCIGRDVTLLVHQRGPLQLILAKGPSPFVGRARHGGGDGDPWLLGRLEILGRLEFAASENPDGQPQQQDRGDRSGADRPDHLGGLPAREQADRLG